MAAHFELRNAANGRYFFNLRAGNNEIILTSSPFVTVDEATLAIDAVKTVALTDAGFERKTADNGKPYFLVKTPEGNILGRSEMYASTTSMENGIKSVMHNAPTAPVKEVLETETASRK